MALLSYALTTVARVKDFMDVTVAGDDTLIENLINSVTDFVEEFCNRRFKLTAYTNELYDGNDYDSLLLDNYPIDTDETFTLQRRTEITNSSSGFDTIESDLYHVKAVEGIIQYVPGFKFHDYPQHYRVTFTAGYDYDNAATYLSDVGAADLEWATWKLVSTAYNNRKVSINAESESIGDYSITWAKEIKQDPLISEILHKYKRPIL